MGSNQHSRNLALAGKVCYICEINPPELVDNVGGKICRPCHTRIQKAILQNIFKDGYRKRVKGES